MFSTFHVYSKGLDLQAVFYLYHIINIAHCSTQCHGASMFIPSLMPTNCSVFATSVSKSEEPDSERFEFSHHTTLVDTHGTRH